MKNKFQDFILNESKKSYFIELNEKIEAQRKHKNVYPCEENIFRCFNYFEPEDTKVVIIGQDPYYLPNQADGLAFSTYDSKCPKSLQNIFKELKKDYPNIELQTYQLEHWAKQKILLLNATLTVNENEPNSHKNFGWSIFINNVLNYLASINDKFIFVLWGKDAYKTVEKVISQNKISDDRILKTSHPSPLGYSKTNKSFKDSHIFKRINEKFNNSIDFSLRKE
ncbi:uracil-DNA glycosylase [Mycoplasmopsis felifaucium]|uniref:Uracil-DNA glycosylase n=1 Tax=Mycoplasmopsis felifaucium TaxID=35768 RepID=A0ABZ2RRR9_9BACT